MTRRGDQIATMGGECGKELMPEGIMDLSLEGLAELYSGYEDDLGYGVKRRIKVLDSTDDSIEVEVHLVPGLNQQEAEHHYRIHLQIEELET
jgi:hypothetical protein